jgi:hypothetical protein
MALDFSTGDEQVKWSFVIQKSLLGVIHVAKMCAKNSFLFLDSKAFSLI